MKRHDSELNELLRTARVPERPREYWEEFPRTVGRQLRWPVAGPTAPVTRRHAGAWGLGLATVGLVLILVAGFWRDHRAGFTAAELAQSRKIYHELAALFPDRLETVQFDGRGSQLVLAAAVQLPASAPLLVQICHAGICRRFITFSGQRVVLNGESFEILADARGHVLVVGDRLAWTSGRPRQAAAGYRIRAAALEAAL